METAFALLVSFCKSVLMALSVRQGVVVGLSKVMEPWFAKVLLTALCVCLTVFLWQGWLRFYKKNEALINSIGVVALGVGFFLYFNA